MSTGIQFDESAAKGVEAIYKTPDVAGQRSQVLAAMAPRPGEEILDIGVGPGLLAWDIGRMVGESGLSAGIDVSEAMIGMASQRCTDGGFTFDFKLGDATALPFADASFDAVVSTQVYEYVADMPKALAEVARVLRPGGRVFILDTDWDTAVWATDDRPRQRRVLDAWEEHLHDPCLPRKLGRLLAEADLQITRRDVIPLLNTALHPNCYSFGMVFAIQNFAAGRRGVTKTEADAWATELRERGARGDYFFSLNRYLFGAVKSGAIKQ